MNMIVQIYTIQSTEEAEELVKIGVDNLGLTPANIGLPGEISIELAKEIFSIVKSKNNIALSVSSKVNEILDMAFYVNPDILHLCGEPGSITHDDLLSIRQGIMQKKQDIKIMQAVSVEDLASVDLAIQYSKLVDYIILDTSTTSVEGIGASGNTHDWNISKKIVDNVSIPVVLAGGLSADNVSEAIKKVRPWAVDSLTHTNKYFPDGSFVKDIKKVSRFIENSRQTDEKN